MPQTALIFANGDIADGVMSRRALAHADHALCIAADGGLRVAQAYGVRLHAVIGDMDSVDLAALSVLERDGVTIARFPAQKDETDLELALIYAVEHGARHLFIFGAMGDRLDQTLSNMYLLALPALRGLDARLVSGSQQAWLMHAGTLHIDGARGDTVSLVPFGGDAVGVRTHALEYPLHDETLTVGPARGISNVMQEDSAQIDLREGRLLVVHFAGKA
jgi:thiamine pyrophosphokinase